MWQLLLLHSLLYLLVIARADLDVCLEQQGCLKGRLMPGNSGEDFEAFLGIPYAKPPIGELRFKNPIASTNWQDVRNATSAGNSCLQRCYFLPNWPTMGEEDCLYLNVYRPVGLSATSEMPVMVYIHAGGLFCGTADPAAVGPEHLMATNEVIVVSINYRLGAFGFLSTGDVHMPGNFGLKDQRLALQWVQQHIAAFGGNPQLVTILGHSAGGLSTHFQMLSPSSKGLFHRAISVSGNALVPWGFPGDSLEQARQLALEAGVAAAISLSTQQLTEALRQVDAMVLLEAGNSLKAWNNAPLVNFRVVVEPDDAPDAFLTEHAAAAHMAGHIIEVPWLLASSSRPGEGSMFLIHIYNDPQLRKEFNENFLELFAMNLYLPPHANPKDTVKQLLQLYDVQEEQLNEETMVPLSGIMGDFNFLYPLYASAEGYAKHAKQPLFLYRFGYRSESGITFGEVFSTSDVPRALGSIHMDDATHIIRMPALLRDYAKGSEDEEVTQRVTSLLVEFAKTGVFNNASDLSSCTATEFKVGQICSYLHLEQVNGLYKESMEQSMDTRGLALWKQLYLQ